MLSRVAENLYWLGRYLERVENPARLLDDGLHLELDALGLEEDGGTGPLDSLLNIFACRDTFTQGNGQSGRDAVLRFFTFDRGSEQSLLGMIGRARENARGTQESLSSEAWSQINQLYLFLSGPRAERRFQSSALRLFQKIKRDCVLLGGLVNSTLPRTEVYHFIQAGRYLQRIDHISRILAVKLATFTEDASPATMTLQTVYWASLLRSWSAYEAYLRKRPDRIEGPSVVMYLVLDPDFPRAMRFAVRRCLESLREIAGGDQERYGSEAERLLGRLDSELRYMDVGEMYERGLPRFLGGVQESCNRIAQAIHQAYFLG